MRRLTPWASHAELTSKASTSATAPVHSGADRGREHQGAPERAEAQGQGDGDEPGAGVVRVQQCRERPAAGLIGQGPGVQDEHDECLDTGEGEGGACDEP